MQSQGDEETVVWIVNQYAQTPDTAGFTRHYYIAKHLAALNFRTTVIAGNFNHLTKQKIRAEDHDHIEETGKNLRYYWINTKSGSSNGLMRLWSFFSFMAKSAFLSKDRLGERPDVIVGCSVPPFSALAGAVLAWRLRVKFVYEVRDFWPESLIHTGQIGRYNPIALGLAALDRFLVWRANKIIVTVPGGLDYYEAKGKDRNDVVCIPNGADTDMFQATPLPQTDGSLRLVYFGGISPIKDLGTLLHAMKRIQDRADAPDISLRIVGDGRAKADLKAMASELGLTNTVFGDAVAKHEIPGIAAGADALVILNRDMPELYRYGISMNKLFEYLASNRPILIASGARYNPVEIYGAGYVLPPENPDALAEGILRMAAESHEQRQEMAAAGLTALRERYSFDYLARVFADTVRPDA